MEIGLGQYHFLFAMIHSGKESSQSHITVVSEGNGIEKKTTIFGIHQKYQSNGLFNELLVIKMDWFNMYWCGFQVIEMSPIKSQNILPFYQ